jgi:hypothetical protein
MSTSDLVVNLEKCSFGFSVKLNASSVCAKTCPVMSVKTKDNIVNLIYQIDIV